MARDWLKEEKATVYVVPKVKKGFDEKLGRTLEKELGKEVEPLRLDDELTEWVVTRATGKARAKGQRSAGTKALWRAFRALAAARYHFRNDPEADAELRELRERVEALWIASS